MLVIVSYTPPFRNSNKVKEEVSKGKRLYMLQEAGIVHRIAILKPAKA